MNILFVTDLYPIKSNEKHIPKTLFNFVQDWKSLGHTVNVLKPNFLLNSFLRKKPFYKTGYENEVYNINFLTPFLFKGNIPDFKYDVIIAHMPSGIIYSNHLSGKLVCGVHCSDIEVLTNPVYSIYFKPQMEKAYSRAKAIACRSEVLKKKFLKLYPQYEQKTFVAASGINDEIIFKTLEKDFINEAMNIVTCGNLIKRKNIDKVIGAVKSFKKLHLTVIGEGPEKNRLIKQAKFSESLMKKLSKDKKIKEQVVFTGQLPKEQVLEYMKKSDIFVLPSVNETFGMVYIEAMASGCIVIGTKNDGIDGIIEDGVNGFLVEPDLKKIFKKILDIKLMEKDALNILLKNCYNTVTQYKSLDCSEKYLENISKFS